MASVKRVLLGTAAGMFAVAGAQAADLPVKAKPVEYVKVCSLYGAGFWYVPGTDTCIKIGAFDQAQVGWGVAGGGNIIGYGTTGGNGSGRNTRTDTGSLGFRNRAAVSFDMRTQTEYGTLRSYISVGQEISTNNNTGGSQSNSSSSFWADRAFIQFGGLTAGRIRSFFDFFNHAGYDYLQGNWTGDTSPNGIFGLAYTYQFGGGLSASLSFEDGGFNTGGRGRTTVDTTQAFWSPAGALTVDNKGQTILDPVVNVRLDQSWGFAGVAAALHDASGGYYGSNLTTNGHPDDKYGFAVTGSFLFTNVFGLKGDTLGAQAVFSRGAAGYATSGYGAKTVYGSGNSVGLGFMSDGVFGPTGGIELTDVWSLAAGYEHFWNPQWKTSLYGGYVDVSYNDTAAGYIRNGLNASGFGVTGSPDFSYSVLGTRTQWNPVPDFSIGLDLSWFRLNTAFAGWQSLPKAGARPEGIYKVEDQDSFQAMFRVQRNFLY